MVQADDVNPDDFTAEDKQIISQLAKECEVSGDAYIQRLVETANAVLVFQFPCEEIIDLDNKVNGKPDVQGKDGKTLPEYDGPTLSASL